MNGILTFQTLSICNGRRSRSSSVLDLSGWPSDSMLRSGAAEVAKASALEPLWVYQLSDVRAALSALSPRTIALLGRSAQQIDSGDVLPMLEAISEDITSRPKTSRDKYYGLTSILRRLLERGPDLLRDGGSLNLVISQSRLQQRRPNRTRPNPQLSGDISQIRHVDWDDLLQQTQVLVGKQKAEIDATAAIVFQRYRSLVAQQRIWLERGVPTEVQQSIENWIADEPTRRGKNFDVSSVDQIDVASVLLQRDAKFEMRLDRNGWSVDWNLGVVDSMAEALPELHTYRYKSDCMPWFHARHRLPNPVLTAVFLVILNYTAWNPGSVGELTLDGIMQRPQGGYQLQSYKGKTDDDTPIVEIPASNKVLCEAISLLLWNHQQLILLGLILPSERRVWFGWQKNGFQEISDVAYPVRIKSFCTNGKIKLFSLSELRPLGAAAAYLPQRDIEAVRVLLGHTTISMSDKYLRNTLFFRLNEANILQFQRRIEATIIYADGGLEAVKDKGLNPADIDHSLLPSTGDGGVCLDIKAGHPAHPLEPGEPCSGLYCQKEDRCPNYRLHVSQTTIQMALRTQQYYQSRWADLASRNEAAFRKLHLPRLLFIHVLLLVVNAQRPDLLKRAKEKLL